MTESLLKEFLSNDAPDDVRLELLIAIREGMKSPIRVLQEFNYDRFNIYLNFQTKEVVIQDDLDVSPEGEHKLDMIEFKKALQEP